MGSRLLWRRSATALGIYGSTALGVLGTVIAARQLQPRDFGAFALVIATVSLFQLLLDLTSEEALVKYGFRYSERGDWGRFHRLFRVAFQLKLTAALASGLLLVAMAPLADAIFDADGLAEPFLIASLLPLLYSFEGIAAAALVLRMRYDVRAWFLFFSMTLRLVAIVIAAPHGVTATVAGIVIAQAISTAAVSTVGLVALRRFPAHPPEPLGEDRPEIVRFVRQSSLGTGIVSVRSWISPILLGLVSTLPQVGYFRAAQAPQQGLAALSSPVRLILLTEQTRDWERGRPAAVLAGVRRYVAGATVLMAVALVPLWLLMPWLVRVVLGERYEPATDAARVILLAAAVQLVFGWTKSFPVSIGRPNLRVLAHGVETAALVPLLLVLGSKWDATGAAVAVLVSTLVFAGAWAAIALRYRTHPLVQAETA
jgi:O-antigen/teichoic acid export membrane protein